MQTMLKKDFWYDLPKELIAQEPADPRDSARLMVLDRKDDSIEHKIFHDLPEYLEPGDLLVVNNSKVLPARIVGVKQPTGAVCELLLLRQGKGDQWDRPTCRVTSVILTPLARMVSISSVVKCRPAVGAAALPSSLA